MGRGIKDHKTFDEFDISAVLNFMHHCNHFKGFTAGQSLTKVRILCDSGHINSISLECFCLSLINLDRFKAHGISRSRCVFSVHR